MCEINSYVTVTLYCVVKSSKQQAVSSYLPFTYYPISVITNCLLRIY